MAERREEYEITITDLARFKDRLYAVADQFKTCFVYDSCGRDAACGYKDYELIAGLGSLVQLDPADHAFDALDEFISRHQDWVFGGLSYDLKNDLESLTSQNPDHTGFPGMRFYIPEHVILVDRDGKQARLLSAKGSDPILKMINGSENVPAPSVRTGSPGFRTSLSEQHYRDNIEKIRENIRSGDVYELNYCMQFVAPLESVEYGIDLYRRLANISPVPFAAYARFDEFEVLSASPERYLKKTGNKLISQPIKGTATRSDDPATDMQNKRGLQHSLKDRAENVMIVDLVRNDLARTCRAGTIQVEELFGIYEFPQVFQMISTITGELDGEGPLSRPIRHSFPMGSMTGAPKIAAMQLIEEYEDFRRGWYAGSLGYISPEGDFDFNVLIRSIFINRRSQTIAYAVGGAITIDSEPRDEFEECMWKASAIKRLFDNVRESGN